MSGKREIQLEGVELALYEVAEKLRQSEDARLDAEAASVRKQLEALPGFLACEARMVAIAKEKKAAQVAAITTISQALRAHGIEPEDVEDVKTGGLVVLKPESAEAAARKKRDEKLAEEVGRDLAERGKSRLRVNGEKGVVPAPVEKN